MSEIPNNFDSIAQKRKEDLVKDPLRLYDKIFELVEQSLHARIVADLVYKYRWERVSRVGRGNSLISFSAVALENFAIQQIWKRYKISTYAFPKNKQYTTSYRVLWSTDSRKSRRCEEEG